MYQENELMHFGTKGQKWGVRRYQNEDGTMTELGKKRYGKGGERSRRGIQRDLNKLDDEKNVSNYYSEKYADKANRREAKLLKKGKDVSSDYNVNEYRNKAKEYKKLSQQDQKFIDKILKKASKKKLSVDTKDTVRTVEKGKTFVSGIASIGVGAVTGALVAGPLIGTPAGAAVGAAVWDISGVSGKKYKVRNGR